jgi:uncharacterized metal-binding protein YceD (DUF177 family)
MLLDISNAVKYEGESIDFSLDCENFQADEFYVENVHAEGEVYNNAGRLELNALITAEAKVPCSRCLEEIILPLSVEIEEKLSNDIDNLDAMYYNDSRVDMNEVAREILSLELPMVVHCNECEV